MADDTRQPESTRPRGPVNMMPGGMANTAGGKSAEEEMPTISDAVSTIKISEYKELHKKPCVREALLLGIGAGFGMGGFGIIIRRTVYTACSYAVGAFSVAAVVQHQYCQRQRKKEKDGMKRIVEVMEKKKNDLEEKKAARRKAKEEKDRMEAEEAARRKTWGYWAERNLKFW